MKLAATVLAALFATTAFAQAPAKKDEKKAAPAPAAAAPAKDAKAAAPAPAAKKEEKKDAKK